MDIFHFFLDFVFLLLHLGLGVKITPLSTISPLYRDG